MAYDTTISINKETREKLKTIKEKSGYTSYDELFNDMIKSKQGVVEDCHVVNKPQVAFVVNSLKIDTNGNGHRHDTLEVYYDELKNADIGTVYTPEHPSSKYYSIETAEILFKDNKSIVVRICETLQLEQLQEFTNLICVELL